MTEEPLEDRLKRLAEPARDQSPQKPKPKRKPEEKPFDISKYLSEHRLTTPLNISSPLDDLKWDPQQGRLVPKKRNTFGLSEMEWDSNQMKFVPKQKYQIPSFLETKSDEYQDEEVELIKGPVTVGIIYRKYSTKHGRPHFGAPEELLYVVVGGEQKIIHHVAKPDFGDIEDAIDNIVLSLDRKKLAFDQREVYFFHGSNNDVKSLYVMDIDGKNILHVTGGDLPFSLERGSDQGDDDAYSYFPHTHKIRPVLSSSKSLYSPNWIDDSTIEFKGQLYYQEVSHGILIENVTWTTGPECSIHANLTKKNKIKNVKIVKEL